MMMMNSLTLFRTVPFPTPYATSQANPKLQSKITGKPVHIEE